MACLCASLHRNFVGAFCLNLCGVQVCVISQSLGAHIFFWYSNHLFRVLCLRLKYGDRLVLSSEWTIHVLKRACLVCQDFTSRSRYSSYSAT